MRRPWRQSVAWRGSADELAPRLVWLLGSPRSGSTWLLHLLGAADRAVMIDEPAIGCHLGVPLGGFLTMRARDVPVDRLRMRDLRRDHRDYALNDRYRDAWEAPARALVLERLRAQVVEECASRQLEDPLVLVKEPHGSLASDLLMSLVPESRLLFLLRDGRDVLDSELDAGAAGSWAADVSAGYVTSDEDRHAFLRDRAHMWALRTTVTARAHDAHPPALRRTVRYEDLVADTVGSLRELDRWLELGLGQDVDRVADVGRADRQPAAVRGPGQFVRAATPGLWREHLSAEEAAMVELVMGDVLRAHGYE